VVCPRERERERLNGEVRQRKNESEIENDTSDKNAFLLE
jgi:hypothetical protein